MKTLLTAILCLLLSGGPSWEEAVLLLSGASAVEELDEETLEHYAFWRDHPLRLNTAGRGTLRSSGLLSDYQTASLLEYRSRCGPVLSLAELALVDGFGERFAEALSCFAVLDGPAPGRGTGGERFSASGDVVLRSGVKATPGTEIRSMLAGKAVIAAGERFRSSAGVSDAYDGARKSSFSAAFTGRGGRWTLVAGDFNARFGQGLALWSGFSLSGVPSAEAMSRNPSGISPASSFSGTGRLRGAACEFNFSRGTVTALWSESAKAANLMWLARSYQGGFTVVGNGGGFSLAADFKTFIRSVDLWGEAAFEPSSRAPAGILGIGWSPAWKTRISLLLRYYAPAYRGLSAGAVRTNTRTSDDAAFSAGFRLGAFSGTADYSCRPSDGRVQVKTLLTSSPSFSVCSGTLTPSVRLSMRFRPADARPLRTDLRGDLDYNRGPWQIHARYNTLWYRARSWLWYAEAGCKGEGQRGRFNASLRGGIFKVDDWDDRIYVYERDLPGMFTVPARYGRGWNASVVCGLKLSGRRFRHALNFRAGIVAYPWTVPQKPSALEARLQYSVSFYK